VATILPLITTINKRDLRKRIFTKHYTHTAILRLRGLMALVL